MKPWIFKEIKEKIDYDISSSERIDILREYAEFALTHWGSDEKGVNTVRDFMCHHLTFMSRYVPVHCCIEKNGNSSAVPRYVLHLAKDALYVSGDGTKNNPYIIK